MTRRRLSRVKALFLHCCLSLVIVLPAAILVFGVWYPYPYREISGGREIFTLIATVNFFAGPLVTLVAYKPQKSRGAIIFDFSVTLILQLCALAYGLWTVFEARPVHVVYEYDRFRVVSAAEVPTGLLAKAPAGLQKLPLWGPTFLSLRDPSGAEQLEMTLSAFAGVHLASRPELWQPYDKALSEIIQSARPMTELMEIHPQFLPEVETLINKYRVSLERIGYLPLQGHANDAWTAIVSLEDGVVLGYLPADSFVKQNSENMTAK